MIPKPIDQITKEDIESLVTAKVPESRTLEYKAQIAVNTTDEKREFLCDLSSFANTAGGDIVFGITDERDVNGNATSLPGSADGITLPNASQVRLQLENLIRDGIDPRIPGLQWQQVEGFPKGPVLVMRIPKSWVGPHMVIYRDLSRFYSRSGDGKHHLDVGEIRSAFLAQAGFADKIRQFVIDRVSKTMQRGGPIPFDESAKVLLHLIPVASLGQANTRDVTKSAAQLQSDLRPISAGGWSPHFNFDGAIVVGGLSNSYVQVFRSGIIEAGAQRIAQGEGISIIGFERAICEATERYLRVQSKLELPLPIFVLITLIGVKGLRLILNDWFTMRGLDEQIKIDRDLLQLPEVLVEDYNVKISRVLRPTFDALWQACGLEQSFNYDDQGNWNPPK